jgi:hypothetical protein
MTPSLITHDFPLRDDLIVRLTLPVDLTDEDAKRMCQFIGSLAFAADQTRLREFFLKSDEELSGGQPALDLGGGA